MWYYIARRILYAIPILLGVNILTFVLFFMVNTPDEIASIHLGSKHVTKQQIADWKQAHGYALPLFYNAEKSSIRQIILLQKNIK